MQFVGRLLADSVASVTDFYKDLNPATLTGAIDVVVVEQPDGSLRCSPFHVRFGKMSLLRPQEKVVEIEVNGKAVDFPMKVSESGEAFFVMRTEDRVPRELQNSPVIPSASIKSVPLETKDVPPLSLETAAARRPASTSGIDDARIVVDANAIPQHAVDGTSIPTLTPSLNAEVLQPSPSTDVLETTGPPRKLVLPVPTQPAIESGMATPGSASVTEAAVSTYSANDALQSTPPFNPFPQHPFSDTELDMQLRNSRRDTAADIGVSSIKQERRVFGTSSRHPFSDTEMDYSTVSSAAKQPMNPPDEVPINVFTPELRELGEFDFQLALCKKPWSFTAVKNAFQESSISFDVFSESPELLNDPSLIIRLGSHFYTWPVIAPFMASLFFFKKPVPHDLMAQFFQHARQPPSVLIQTSASVLGPVNSKTAFSRPNYYLGGLREWWNSPTNTKIDDVPSAEAVQTRSKQTSDDRPKKMTAEFGGFSEDEGESGKLFIKTLRLTSEQLRSLNLKHGPNTISFSVNTRLQGKATCTARLFLWRHDVQVVISDIDGTITKSDALGHLFNIVGKDWTHPGIAKLYTNINRNGYQLLYLTSRAIGQADVTRGYLRGVEQGSYRLPDGPVIMSPDRMMVALKREVIDRRPEEFKIACLRDVKRLFGERNPFYAGFGNRITDAMSYRAVSIPTFRIYSINPNGEIKMDFFSGYKSSYINLNDLVDHIFPPIVAHRPSLSSPDHLIQESTNADAKRGLTTGEQNLEADLADYDYSDFSFWKAAIPAIDIPELDSSGAKKEARNTRPQSAVESRASRHKSGRTAASTRRVRSELLQHSLDAAYLSKSAPSVPIQENMDKIEEFEDPGLLGDEEVETSGEEDEEYRESEELTDDDDEPYVPGEMESTISTYPFM